MEENNVFSSGATNKSNKIHQLTIFDFLNGYDDEKEQDFKIDVSNDIQRNENIERQETSQIEEKTSEKVLKNTQSSKFELSNGYGISNSNKESNLQEKIDFAKTQNIDLGGVKTRAENNLKALELAYTITKENRYATQEEQEILAKYSGFGGLSSVFSDENFNERLKTLLDTHSNHKLESAETYAKLMSSSYNAYYTNDMVVDTIYQGLEQFGLKNTAFKKEILEPSCGTGNFLHRGDKSSYNFTGVELEKHSALIAKLLHPNSKIINNGYEYVNESKKFDAIIGNPPFGQDKIKDNNSLAHNQSIDNYFVIKSLENLKDKGIVAFVMPTGFLDNNKDKHLDFITQARGKFLGAVRLPNTIFKGSGTEVNTDIIFLQKEPEFIEKFEDNTLKKVKNEIEPMPNVFLNASLRDKIDEFYDKEIEKNVNIDYHNFLRSFRISSYYLDNPQNILGEQVIEKNQFGDYKAVVKDDGRDLALALQNFIKTLPQNIYEYEPNTDKEKLKFDFVKYEQEYIKSLKKGNYFYNFEDNSICQKLNDMEYQKLDFSTQTQNKAKDYILLRDSLNALSSLELNEKSSDEEIDKARVNLNEIYDFIKKSNQNKPLNKIFNELEDELHFNFIANLEDENNQKRDIFTKRINFPKAQVKIENAKDAYVASLSKFGKLNMEFLEQALPQDLQTTLNELEEQKLIFKDHNKTFNYITRMDYLSGNVKEKYKEVERAIEKGVEGLEGNLESLKEVFPQDKSIKDIYFNLAMPFIPDEIYTEFAKYALANAGMKEHYFYSRGENTINNFKVNYVGSKYSSNLKSLLRPNGSSSNYYSFYEDNPFYRLMFQISDYISYEKFREEYNFLSDENFEKMKRQAILVAKFDEIFSRQNKVIEKITYDEDGNEIKKIHEDLTADLNSVAKDLQEQFVNFVLSNSNYQKIITKAYNEKLNTQAKKNYGDNYLNLANISQDISLKEHQKSAAWRGIVDRSALINHEVGAGKTMTGVVIAIESKEMNLVNKPMIVVPNHLLPTWESEIKKLYPNKNVLVADHKSMNKNKREAFLSKIKLNDYDLIVIKESQFKLIKKNVQALLNLEQQRLNELESLKDIADNNKERFLSKKLKNEIKMQTRIIDRLKNDKVKNDNMLSFDELGVDCLIIDEAHHFKNLSFNTQKQKVLGLGNSAGSAKAKELYTITQQFYEENKKVVFLTGTPISNSLSEMYHMQRYLQPDYLTNKGFNDFDAWANTFGNDVSDYELDAGGNPKMVTRFSEFNNLGELVGAFSEVNDYVSREKIESLQDTNLIPKAEIIKVVAKRSPEVANFFGVPDKFGNYPQGTLLWRFENFKDNPIENNPLRLTSYARLASLDYRCIENKPEYDFKDSKINLCVKNIVENYYHNKAEFNSTQLVFCDLAVAKTKLENIMDIEQTNKQKESILENAFSIIYTDGNIEKLEREEYENFVKSQKFGLNKDELQEALNQGWVIEQDENGKFRIINPSSAESEVDINKLADNYTNSLSKFDAYKDLAIKLMKNGIPKEHIAFIHDYKKDSEKQELYKKLNSGEIRILIGSTSKMGTGMNVQKRLVALHNIDCPWRPDGYIQRNGRIERQGNMFFEQDKNFKPKIYNYATEMSYDVKAYQIVETKAKAIDTIQRANELNIQSFEDISQNAITFAEMKAISSGNPLLLEQFKIESELKKLQKQERLFLLNKSETTNRIIDLETEERVAKKQIESLEKINLSLNEYDVLIKNDYFNLQNPQFIKFFKSNYSSNDVFEFKTYSKDSNKDENIKEAKLAFQNRIRNDIKEWRDNPKKYREKGSNYFPVIMEYKNLCIIPKIEEYAVQFCLMSKDDYHKNNKYPFSNNHYSYGYLDNENSSIEPKSLKMSKDMFFSNNINYDYFVKRIDNFLKDIDAHLQKEKENLNTIVKDKEQSQNLLNQITEFPQKDLLNALKNDKEIIIGKIQNKEKDWIPSYKTLYQKNEKSIKKEQNFNYN